MNANAIIDRISEEVCGKYPADPIERLNREVGMLRYELRRAVRIAGLATSRSHASKQFHLNELAETYMEEGNYDAAQRYRADLDDLMEDEPTIEDIDQWEPDAMQQAKEYAEAMNG